MAELLPNWIQENCYTAQLDRLFINNVVGSEGVADIAGGSLLVTTGGADLELDVAQGGGFVEGDDDDRGMYSVYNDAPVTLDATAANPTNPRIDQVIARVYDSTYGEGADIWVLEMLDGTPTGGATLSNLNGATALPDNSIRLAYVLVPATFSGPFVNATHILDARTPWTTADSTQWHQIGDAGEPAFTNSWVNFGSGYTEAAFRREGDRVWLRGVISTGTLGSSAFTLPPAYRPLATVLIPAETGLGADYVEVGTDGTVKPTGGTNTSAALEHISYSLTA